MTQLIVIIVYLALLVFLGVYASRFFKGTTDDYMLASHSIGSFLLLMSLFGTTMTAFALLGSTGRSFAEGVGIYGKLASAGGIVHSLCFLVIGVPLWAIGRRNGYRTQIQFFRDRFDSQIIGLLLFPILVMLVVTYLLLGVVGAGAVVNAVTQDAFTGGVPNWMASAVVCSVVLTYVFFGGMRGTAWANAFQTIVFMVLGIATFVTIANALGGTDSLLENMKIATSKVPSSHLGREMFTKAMYFSFLFIPLSVAMFPHVFQHWLTAKSARTFKLPIIMHPIMIMIVWAPCVLIGIWAASPESGIAAGSNPNQVLATLVNLHAGDLLGGLLTAGILAAIMSSLDSQFLCVGTMFAEDIVKDSFGNPFKDKTMVWITRLFVVLIVVITFLLSLVLPRSVFQLGIWSFSGFTGLFPLVFAAIYWRRVTAWGAIACTVVAATSWIFLFSRSGFGANKGYAFPEKEGLLSLGGLLPPMLPVVTILLLSTTALVVVSLLTRPPAEKTLDKFFKS